MGSVLDVGPVMVSGAVRARHARIVWADGNLYVVTRRAGRIDRQVVATTEPTLPETRNGYYRMRSDDGKTIKATRRGCGG